MLVQKIKYSEFFFKEPMFLSEKEDKKRKKKKENL